jgi:hypothetical protein
MNTSSHWSRSVKTCRTWVSSLAACVLVAAGVVVTAPPASAKVCDGTSVPCAIGDTGPGGGIVFYDAGSVQSWGRYLEAAPCKYQDRERCKPGTWVKQHDPQEPWCKADRDGYRKLLPTGTDIGTGRANTEIIVQACGPDSAASVAAAYRGGGKDDWFLPSKDELNALYKQRRVVGALAFENFWSSSQSSRSEKWVWFQDFRNRTQVDSGLKWQRFRVRPVRAF